MTGASESQHLTADLESIEALLEKLPASRVLERIGFEARRDEVKERLAKLERGEAPAEGAPVTTGAPEQSVALPSRGLAEEIQKLDALLAGLPPSRVLERAGLEARRDELQAELVKTRETAKPSAARLSIRSGALELTLHWARPVSWIAVLLTSQLVAAAGALVSFGQPDLRKAALWVSLGAQLVGALVALLAIRGLGRLRDARDEAGIVLADRAQLSSSVSGPGAMRKAPSPPKVSSD